MTRVKLPPKVEELDDRVNVQERNPGDGEHVTLSWPPYFPSSWEDLAKAVGAMKEGTGGQPVVSQETAVERLAPMVGVEDAKAELRRIDEDAEGNMDRAARALAGGAPRVPPIDEKPMGEERGSRDQEGAKQKPNLDHIEKDLRKLAVNILDLTPDPNQSHVHDRRGLDELKVSLSEHGQKKPIVVQKRGMIVKAGNGTLQAAQELGWTHLAAVVSSDPAKALRAYALRDNRTAEFATWDSDALFGEIDFLGGVPDDFGWTEDDLAGLLPDLPSEPRGKGVSFNAAPPGTVLFKFGQYSAHVPEAVYDAFEAAYKAKAVESGEPMMGDVLKGWLGV